MVLRAIVAQQIAHAPSFGASVATNNRLEPGLALPPMEPRAGRDVRLLFLALAAVAVVDSVAAAATDGSGVEEEEDGEKDLWFFGLILVSGGEGGRRVCGLPSLPGLQRPLRAASEPPRPLLGGRPGSCGRLTPEPSRTLSTHGVGHRQQYKVLRGLTDRSSSRRSPSRRSPARSASR